jgi:hypothetical protein
MKCEVWLLGKKTHIFLPTLKNNLATKENLAPQSTFYITMCFPFLFGWLYGQQGTRGEYEIGMRHLAKLDIALQISLLNSFQIDLC